MKLKVVGDWIQYATESGQTFYYNDRTGNFQWNHPEALSDYAALKYHSNSSSTYTSPLKDDSSQHSKSQQIENIQSVLTQSSIGEVIGDWKQYLDPDSGSMFWYNHVTEISQWDYPSEIDLKQVHHNDDLGLN